jgi:hypothetical protein
MLVEYRMDSRVRRNESIRRYIVASWLVLCLTPAGRGQEAETRPSPAAGEAVTNEEPGEGRSVGEVIEAAEAIEDKDFIETDRNSFTFARVTPGANRLIVESSFSYINLTREKSTYSCASRKG